MFYNVNWPLCIGNCLMYTALQYINWTLNTFQIPYHLTTYSPKLLFFSSLIPLLPPSLLFQPLLHHFLPLHQHFLPNIPSSTHLFILIQQMQSTATKAPRNTRHAMVSTATCQVYSVQRLQHPSTWQ